MTTTTVVVVVVVMGENSNSSTFVTKRLLENGERRRKQRCIMRKLERNKSPCEGWKAKWRNEKITHKKKAIGSAVASVGCLRSLGSCTLMTLMSNSHTLTLVIFAHLHRLLFLKSSGVFQIDRCLRNSLLFVQCIKYETCLFATQSPNDFILRILICQDRTNECSTAYVVRCTCPRLIFIRWKLRLSNVVHVHALHERNKLVDDGGGVSFYLLFIFYHFMSYFVVGRQSYRSP